MARYWRGVAPNAVSMQVLASKVARARTAALHDSFEHQRRLDTIATPEALSAGRRG